MWLPLFFVVAGSRVRWIHFFGCGKIKGKTPAAFLLLRCRTAASPVSLNINGHSTTPACIKRHTVWLGRKNVPFFFFCFFFFFAPQYRRFRPHAGLCVFADLEAFRWPQERPARPPSPNRLEESILTFHGTQDSASGVNLSRAVHVKNGRCRRWRLAGWRRNVRISRKLR